MAANVSVIVRPQCSLSSKDRIKIYKLSQNKEYIYPTYIWRMSLKNSPQCSHPSCSKKSSTSKIKKRVLNKRRGKPNIKKIATEIGCHYETVRKYLKFEHEKTRNFQKEAYNNSLSKSREAKRDYYYNNKERCIFQTRFSENIKNDLFKSLSANEQFNNMINKSITILNQEEKKIAKRKINRCIQCNKISKKDICSRCLMSNKMKERMQKKIKEDSNGDC